MASKTLWKKWNRTLRINKVGSFILPSQKVIPSDEKSKGIMRQERHTGQKGNQAGATNRGPMFKGKDAMLFSDLLLCCFPPVPLMEQTVMDRALIQRKTSCGWGKGDSIG